MERDGSGSDHVKAAIDRQRFAKFYDIAVPKKREVRRLEPVAANADHRLQIMTTKLAAHQTRVINRTHAYRDMISWGGA